MSEAAAPSHVFDALAADISQLSVSTPTSSPDPSGADLSDVECVQLFLGLLGPFAVSGGDIGYVGSPEAQPISMSAGGGAAAAAASASLEPLKVRGKDYIKSSKKVSTTTEVFIPCGGTMVALPSSLSRIDHSMANVASSPLYHSSPSDSSSSSSSSASATSDSTSESSPTPSAADVMARLPPALQRRTFMVISYIIPGAPVVAVNSFFMLRKEYEGYLPHNNMDGTPEAAADVERAADFARAADEAQAHHSANKPSGLFGWGSGGNTPLADNAGALGLLKSQGLEGRTDGGGVGGGWEWLTLLQMWWCGNDQFKSERMKLIPRIVDGPWAVKSAVGSKPALIGTKLISRYYRQKNYLQVDVDIGSSSTAARILALVRDMSKAVSIDLAITIEGCCEAELPERIIHMTRFTGVDMVGAVTVADEDIKGGQAPRV